MADAVETAEAGAEAAEVVDTAAAPAEAQSEGAAEQTIEQRAQGMGWKPSAEFKGDPKDFVDAAEYVRRGEEVLPFLKATNRNLEKELTDTKKELKRLSTTLDTFAQHHSKTEARAYERAMAELEAKQAQAVVDNDVAGVKAITEEIVDLRKEVAAKPETGKADFDTAFKDWHGDNDWFRSKDDPTSGNRAMTVFAMDVYADLPETLSHAERLTRVTKAVRDEFPHKFENGRRSAAPAVEGAGALGSRKGGKTYADLPPDAKAMCDGFVKDIKGFTREKYVKDFFG